MKFRTPGLLVAVLLATSLAACSDSAEAPSPTTPAATTTTAPAEPPEQQVPVPGEPLTVLFMDYAPAAEGDEAFAPTIEGLAELGYDVAPIDVSCVEGGAKTLGVEDDPTSRAVVLYFDSFETADTFSTLWSGNIYGSVETTVCEQAAG
ncbi:hypothetical protein SANBI_001516 [Sanguibacter sp. 4.1]|uniref:Lipoprotein n=1 Tax=Sanguibacter biliveldensis TaxID=3030830 RepID=A0AAF0ZAL7_9MICO|nr:hypothetical protein [Sanguibacter sp. 4.1]WPF83816.1 hypothetical protein SANBI_001516 [Sanguibacter sp. 4.1]